MTTASLAGASSAVCFSLQKVWRDQLLFVVCRAVCLQAANQVQSFASYALDAAKAETQHRLEGRQGRRQKGWRAFAAADVCLFGLLFLFSLHDVFGAAAPTAHHKLPYKLPLLFASFLTRWRQCCLKNEKWKNVQKLKRKESGKGR